MNVGLTFDAGALIALERRRQRVAQIYAVAASSGVIVTAPVAAIAEWWRGRNDVRERILHGVRIEPMDADLARRAGEALAAVRGSTTVDAIVMASAARRGDRVITSDVGDLERLRDFFPDVRVLSV
jgi:predicted nucleic acid-binding protein